MIIKAFNLDLSNIPASGEIRTFDIIGDNGAEFILEIKDSDTSSYYNFYTNTFQSTRCFLETSITSGVHAGFINFPAVGSRNQWDIFLYAKPGTTHVDYSEVRFADNTIDINSSIGSNSLMLQKVIYAYPALTLTLQGVSPNSSVTGTFATQTISVDRGKSKGTTPFSITATSLPSTSYKIIKQPDLLDLLSFASFTVGSSPELLPDENKYTTATPAFTGDTVDAAVTSGSVVRMTDVVLSEHVTVGDKITSPISYGVIAADGGGEGRKVVMGVAVAGIMAVGDQVSGPGCTLCNTQVILVTHLDPDGDNANEFQVDIEDAFQNAGDLNFSSKVNRSLTTVTVVETSGVNTDFTMSQAIQFRSGQSLTFTKQKNYQWPLDDISKITEGNFVIAGTNVTTGSLVSSYEKSTTINAGTQFEEILISQQIPALRSKNQKPTITDGVITTQPGNVIFNNQQVLALAGDTIQIGGYGQQNFSTTSGYSVLFTDLAISLSPITTTTTSAVSDSTTVPVASVNGIAPGISAISGIGIDATEEDPIVESRSVTSGAGNLILSSAQTLEDGVTLTSSNAGQIATITGNVEIIQAGTADKTIFFDVERLLSVV